MIGLVVAAIGLVIVLGLAAAFIALKNAIGTSTPAQAAASSDAQALKDQRYDGDGCKSSQQLPHTKTGSAWNPCP